VFESFLIKKMAKKQLNMPLGMKIETVFKLVNNPVIFEKKFNF
jgi:hypothetical protein